MPEILTGATPAVQIAIHKVGVRAALHPRREPYWAPPLGLNQSMGFRKIAEGRGSWVARRKENGKSKYKALGPETATFGFIEARTAALKWFANLEHGVSSDRTTVSAACKLYVADRKKEKGEQCAHDADMRFRRTIYENALGDRLLEKVRAPHI